MLRCHVFGHRFRFAAHGETMSWSCERGCGASGSKRYATAADAERYARAFDKDDRPALGRGTPLAVLPLRLGRAALDRLRRR